MMSIQCQMQEAVCPICSDPEGPSVEVRRVDECVAHLNFITDSSAINAFILTVTIVFPKPEPSVLVA